ncbi:MAG: HAMP domain-containing sensor histidine kinase [bacterium]|nr:HAMP domain-containing sensor histidine kinase [bacterium]
MVQSSRFDSLNLNKICGKYRVSLWQCPQFLFLVMGMVIIVAIISAYVVASKYQEPELAAVSVLILAVVLFVVGHMIISAFEKVATASLSKSEFISIMSHQLRSPLSAVKWQLNMMLSGDGNAAVSNESRNFLEAIYDQNERMIRAVNDLLEVNRIEDGDLVMRPSLFSLFALTGRVAGEFEKFSLVNNTKISILAQKDLPMVYADEERIRRVMEHLIDNAVRYSAQKGDIAISLEKKNDNVLCKISDQGTGISDSEKTRVFDKFFRSVNAARYQTEGSGVGLFIAKSIIKLSGGEIGFSSLLGKGSIFWFILPVRRGGGPINN